MYILPISLRNGHEDWCDRLDWVQYCLGLEACFDEPVESTSTSSSVSRHLLQPCSQPYYTLISQHPPTILVNNSILSRSHPQHRGLCCLKQRHQRLVVSHQSSPSSSFQYRLLRYMPRVWSRGQYIGSPLLTADGDMQPHLYLHPPHC